MKLRGTRGGIILSLDAQDGPESVEAALGNQAQLLAGNVFLEVASRAPWPAVEAAAKCVHEAGGTVSDVRSAAPAAAAAAPPAGETVILNKTVRSGTRVETAGSAVILADVNAGAEVVAAGDIIVLGLLRGLAHAGAAGNENAVIWAQGVQASQLRIAGYVAQAGSEEDTHRGPEIASIRNGQIVLRPWGRGE